MTPVENALFSSDRLSMSGNFGVSPVHGDYSVPDPDRYVLTDMVPGNVVAVGVQLHA